MIDILSVSCFTVNPLLSMPCGASGFMDAIVRTELALLLPALAAAGYFAFRYHALKQALRDLSRQLSEIRQDISRNQILQLPLPDTDLESIAASLNHTLEDVRRERFLCRKREQDFQKQIENISHDLRTPLTVILGYLKFIRKYQKDGQQSPAESLEIIEKNARIMEKLVTQFYTYSLLNALDTPPKLHSVDVCRILRESIVSHSQFLDSAGLNLNHDLPRYPISINGSSDALERIFSNLMQNACRYARSFLDIRLEQKEGCVRILFLNDTERISESDVPHLFERFYKNDFSRTSGGTGLGLPIAKSLAELMGGTLTAHVCREESPFPEPADEIIRICFTLAFRLQTKGTS